MKENDTIPLAMLILYQNVVINFYLLMNKFGKIYKFDYSTVTLLARFLGWSTLHFLKTAI
jgi:hypothetical protein